MGDDHGYYYTCDICGELVYVVIALESPDDGERVLELIHSRVPESDAVEYFSIACEGCRDAIEELTEHWPNENPREITANFYHYDEETTACGFCGDEVTDEFLILEFKQHPSDNTQIYVLCPGCDRVFREFLNQLRGGCDV